MKTISKHLGEIILAIAGVALVVGVVLAFSAPIGTFFEGVTYKLTEIGTGSIWDLVEFGGSSDDNGETETPQQPSVDAETGKILDTWEQIIASVNDGSYVTKYAVGNYKELDLGTAGTVNMQIAAFNADVLSNDTGNAPITWIAKELLSTTYAMNSSSGDCTSEWTGTDMRTYLQNDIWALIPEVVRNAIVSVDKTYYDRPAAATSTSSDKVWIPSYREVGLESGGEDSGVIYSGLFTDNNSRIKLLDNSASDWWLRSAGSTLNRTFRSVNAAGSSSTTTCTTLKGIALGFCLGVVDNTENDGDVVSNLASPENIRLSGTTLMFDAVENADQYILTVDGGTPSTHTSNSIDVTTYLAKALDGQVIKFKITASNSAGNYANSEPASYDHEIPIVAGLYDANDNLVASWAELTETYGMDVTANYSIYSSNTGYYKTKASSPYYVLTNSADLSTGVKLVIGGNVTTIGNYAFYDCASLTSIELLASVETIGSWSFANCTSLENVTFAENGKLTTISHDAFSGCKSLTSIEITEGITTIGEYAFENCTSLTSVEISDSVTSIKPYAFQNCTSLESIEIPASVTTIGGCVFLHCTSLTSIAVDDNNASYKSVDGNLYSKNGTELLQYAVGKPDTSFAILDGVTTIWNSACHSATSLKSITIPDTVTTIEFEAFRGCTSLASIEIPASVETIGSSAFAYCTSLTSVTFAENSQLTSIGTSVFTNCTSLTSIEIPEGVTTIEGGTFSNCTSLESLVIPEGVTSIGGSAFEYSGIKSIVIPSTVTSIGQKTFRHSSLSTINYEGTMEQWNAISKGTSWRQYVPETEVVCTDGTITLAYTKS